MAVDPLSSIDNLEQEVAELQAQLRDSIPVLAQLNDIPGQFAVLAAESAALNAASAAAAAEAQTQAEQLAARRAALDERLAQLVEQWNSFRSAAETEQHQVLRIAMTTRQELTERAEAQAKLVAALDERLEKMNSALTNMVSDLQAARRDQKRQSVLVTIGALAALALSAAAAWAVYFA